LRLLVYSQDGLGLGHLRRATNIAAQVLAREPGSNVLVLADSPATPFFDPVPGLDYVKLPTIVKVSRDGWRPAQLSFGVEEAIRLRAAIILESFRQFRPDVVLVDHMPVGAMGELKPLLDRAASLRRRRPRLFLGIRDVLDRPQVIRSAWRELGAYDYLPLYEAVLVYGSRSIYDTARAYELTPHVSRVAYCQYVTGSPQRPGLRSSSRVPLVIVTGGGGSDAFPVAKAFVDALPLLAGVRPLKALILTGPNMPPEQRMILRTTARGYPVELAMVGGDAPRYFGNASAVVTMAGYNSLCEVLSGQKKALVVPRRGPSAEQRIRARLFSRRRLISGVDPFRLHPEVLADELVQLLDDGSIPDTEAIPPLDGAARAASVLIGEEPEAERRPMAVAAGA
jgi:predicted glycosyltransferase